VKKVERGELLGLAEYERIREPFRSRIIGEKKERRIIPSGEISVVFENRDTVLYQIQEMLRTERITSEPAIMHEMETYNDLVPGDDELSATMFVELPDAARRDARLVELAGLEGHIAMQIAGQLVRARNETRGVLPDRTTAVHYLKLVLGKELSARFRQIAKDGVDDAVLWVLDHPKLSVRFALPLAVVRRLAADL
jgi:hypothetical protein